MRISWNTEGVTAHTPPTGVKAQVHGNPATSHFYIWQQNPKIYFYANFPTTSFYTALTWFQFLFKGREDKSSKNTFPSLPQWLLVVTSRSRDSLKLVLTGFCVVQTSAHLGFNLQDHSVRRQSVLHGLLDRQHERAASVRASAVPGDQQNQTFKRSVQRGQPRLFHHNDCEALPGTHTVWFTAVCPFSIFLFFF